jgi:type IV pilus assembly protein PilO
MALELGFDTKKITAALRNPPKPVKIVVNVVPAVIVLILCVVLVVLPKNKQINELKAAIVKQEESISKKQAMVAKLKELKQEIAKIKEELIHLEEALPEEGEISSLLKQVTELTFEAGLEINTWRPDTKKRSHKSGIVYAKQAQISLSGSYHRLGQFFSSLTRLKRIVNISNITLSSPKLEGNEVMLNVNFTAVTFVAVPEKKIK